MMFDDQYVPAHLDSPGQRAVKRWCVCFCEWDIEETVVG